MEDCALPNVPPVTDCGWKIENDKLIPILMEREGVPDLGLTVVYCKCKTGCTVNSRCLCRSGNLLYTKFYECENNDCCSNKD